MEHDDLPWMIHQSDLQSWNRCPREFYFDHTMPGEGRQLSATAFGSVLHHAMHVLERDRDLEVATNTFLYYWHPMNIEAVCPPVPSGGWLPGHSYGELRKRGVDVLRKYADVLRHDDHELLALEYEFAVPLRGLTLKGRPVWLAGTADRLAVRWYRRRETLCIDDFKTGKQKWGLRHNVQGTAYAYASMQPEFWESQDIQGIRLLAQRPSRYITNGFDGQVPLDDRNVDRSDELRKRLGPWPDTYPAPRRFTWINLQSFKWVDGGHRGPRDFQRLKEAVANVILSASEGIFPLRIDGETCRFCAYAGSQGPCGVPDDIYADPAFALEIPTGEK